MGLFQGLADFYDYKIEYYRLYAFRRLLFGEKDKEPKARFNIFTNNDSENSEKLILASTKLGFAIGFSISILSIPVLSHYKKLRPREIILRSIGVCSLFTGTGTVYGSVVTISSNLRNKKDDPYNHLIAGAVALPALAVLARSNKSFWATGFGVWGGIITGFSKAIGHGDVYLGTSFKEKKDYQPYFNNSVLLPLSASKSI